MGKVSVLSGPERRQRWSTIEKLRIVEESQAASARVVDVARRNDLHPNLLTAWRRQARTGSLGAVRALRQESEVQFAAVSVAPEPSAWAARAGTGGTIEIAFSSGVQLRITGAVGPATLTAATRLNCSSDLKSPLGVGLFFWDSTTACKCLRILAFLDRTQRWVMMDVHTARS